MSWRGGVGGASPPALVAFFPLMVNTIVGLRSADEDRINLMRSLAATRGQIFWMLQLPNAMPYIFAGLEIAMIFALIGAIVAEFVGAQSGLGMLMQSMNFTMDVAGQFSVLLILSVLGLLLNSLVGEVRRDDDAAVGVIDVQTAKIDGTRTLTRTKLTPRP